jgi:hypothetical protein
MWAGLMKPFPAAEKDLGRTTGTTTLSNEEEIRCHG